MLDGDDKQRGGHWRAGRCVGKSADGLPGTSVFADTEMMLISHHVQCELGRAVDGKHPIKWDRKKIELTLGEW
jgi:hypothetical protein